MRRLGLSIVSVMLAIGITAPVVFAGNIHLKPPNSKPSFTDNGLTLTASATLAGLGNQDLSITLTATANVTATCTNPAGQTQPPGQNPAPITVASPPLNVAASAIKNGNLTFTTNPTTSPTTPIPGAPGCPNPNWTEAISDLAFTSARITVTQGTATFVVNCTFSPPTSNGPVPASSVSCTTS